MGGMNGKVLNVVVDFPPEPAPPKGTLLVRPAFEGGCFRIQESLPRSVLKKIGRNAFHLSQSALEDMDLFGLSPGWRFNLSALETLIAEGYTLRVEGWGVVKSTQELRAMFSSENIARVLDARKAVKEAAKEAAQREAEMIASEGKRWRWWVKRNLTGLVGTTVFPPEVYGNVSGEGVRFRIGYSAEVTYQRITVGGATGWLERSISGAVIAHVPPAVANKWYRQHWETHRSPERALWILNRLLSPWLFKDDYPDWVGVNIGKEGLVALARSGAPIPVKRGEAWAYAVASKCYRIPIAVEVYNAKSKRFERQVGYGNPIALSSVEVWVPLGQENRATWPSPQEIAWLERMHEEEKRRRGRTVMEIFYRGWQR